MAAMFVSLRRTQTWRLHTKLYKFGWHTSANNLRMKNSRDLILGEVVYISIIYRISDSWLYSLNGYDFSFDHMTGENRELYKWKILHDRAWIWILSLSVQFNISRVQRMSEMLSWSQEDKIHIHKRACNSGAPADRTATKQSPILIWERKGNPSMNLLVVNMASGIARGRVPTTMTTATESRKMAAILQIIGWQGLTETSIYRLLLWYWTTLLWSIDTCQSKVSADQYHVTISWAQVYSSSRSRVFFEVDRWPSSVFFIASWAHVRLTLLKTRQDCSEAC